MIKQFKKIKKSWLALIIAAGLVVVMVGCSGGQGNNTQNTDELSGSFNIIGSNTIEPISVLCAEEFMKMHSKVRIAVSGPGSGVGIANLIDGTTDVAQASRPMSLKEIDQAQAKGINPHEIQIAIDALAVVVNPANPVAELTFAQLSAIYTNEITNWKEVGGDDAPIVVISRDINSGTHVFFKEHVVQMNGLPTGNTNLEYGTKVLFLPSTEQGVSEVAKNPKAICYTGLGYVTSAVKPLAIKKIAASPAVLPSTETALDGSYPIARPLFYYTNGEPAGVIKAFIDYVLSPAGQAKVVEAEYVPLP